MKGQRILRNSGKGINMKGQRILRNSGKGINMKGQRIYWEIKDWGLLWIVNDIKNEWIRD